MKFLRPLFLLIFLSLLIFLVVLSSLSFTLPPIIKNTLKDYDIEFDVKKLNIQLHKGSISVQNLILKDVDSVSAVTLGRLDLHVDILALLKRRVVVESLSIADVEIPIVNKAKHIEIAGIEATRFNSEKKPSEKNNIQQAPDYSFVWRSLKFSDIKMSYTPQALLSASSSKEVLPILLIVNHFDVGALDSRRKNDLTSLIFDVVLENINANVNSEIAPLSVSRFGHADVKIQDINLEVISAIAKSLAIDIPAELESAKGVINYDGELDWKLASEEQSLKLDSTQITASDLLFTIPSKPYNQVLKGEINLAFDQAEYHLLDKTFLMNSLSTQDTKISMSVGDPALKTVIDFNDIQFNIDKINTANKSQKSHLVLNSAIGEFGKINLVSDINLLNLKADSDIIVKGEQINLTELSYFANNALNRSIDKGALDFTFNGQVENAFIDSKVNLQMHQLGFGVKKSNKDGVSNEKKSAFEKELGIPLNTALNLLRDKDDTIRLDLPITGPVDDPKININSIINKAVIKTLKTAVITQLGPLMAISALDKLKSLKDATKLRPIYFSPGMFAVTPEARVELDKLSVFLNKRKKLFVNVCAFATSADLSSNLKHDQLTLLAKQRMSAVKEYLINKGGVSGKRLILCAPKIDEGEAAKPRADFSL